MHILIVDLLAERQAFGREGVREIISHFDSPEVSLWSPHVAQRVDYEFGVVVEKPVDSDLIIITGSQRNVSEWEPWMDDVAHLIQTTTTPLLGICFGHQIIAASLGGQVKRAEKTSALVSEVTYSDGRKVNALFTHQDHVVDSGEMVTTASAGHCSIAACQHPERPIFSVQYHPEAVSAVIENALLFGEMTQEESLQFDLDSKIIDMTEALVLPLHSFESVD
tara:strand:+ start:37652 stop:38317 length:666 start_codon:yes stop_codon:yes gene_type:complete